MKLHSRPFAEFGKRNILSKNAFPVTYTFMCCNLTH